MIQLHNPQYFHFLQQADALRRSGSLCDTIVSVNNCTFHAHRLVLACASRKLAQMLSQDHLECPVQCTLGVLSPHTFRQVLDFTYTQVLEVSEEDLHLLLRAAQILEMESLEEQCRKQLNSLQYKCDKRESIKQMKQPTETGMKKKETNQDSVLLSDETDDCTMMEKSFSSEYGNNPQSLKRSAVTTECNRDSVITTATSHYSSPWTLPANMWSSVETLRQIAHNYSTLMSTNPVPLPNQSTTTCPFSMSTRHVFIPSTFQRPAQRAFMSYPKLHPYYSQNIYTAPTRVGSIIRQGLLKRKRQKALATHDRRPSSTNAAEHCSSHLSDPGSQESAKTGGRSCGEDVTQHDLHSQEEHRVEKPFQCKHCSKKFSLKHQLDTHHRVHTGEKPFECRLCGQRSRDYSAMIKHLRTHGGAAPYQCTACLEYCSTLVAMQRHVKSHSVQDFPSDWSINSTYLYRSHI